MGGFGGVFAAVMIGIIFTIAMSSILSLSIQSLMLSDENRFQDDQSSPSIGSGAVTETRGLMVNVTLSGSRSMRIAELPLSDAFVVYLSDGERVAERLPYCGAPSGWSVSRVLTGGAEGDMVNPIDLTSQTGMWDPGETLELGIVVSSDIDLGSGFYFSIAMADGGSAGKAFGPGA